MLIVDYYSKFIAIENLQNPQSNTITNKCKKVFSKFGIPKELIMDSSRNFPSYKFRLFSKTWDILHKTISPHYHQSNGLAERSIQRTNINEFIRAVLNFFIFFYNKISQIQKSTKRIQGTKKH